MFGAAPIRYLSRSEEIFAQSRNFIGSTLLLQGRVNVAAVTRAFDTLLQAHPVLAGHLELAQDGRHQIVVDDYLHPGIWLAKDDDPVDERLPDQSVALVNLRLRIGDRHSSVTLYIHHAVADAHHQGALVEELFGFYTDFASGVDVGVVRAAPVPRSLEAILEERGITKQQQRSGLERFMPAILTYDLPPSKRNPGDGQPLPIRVPTARHRFTEQETRGLLEVAAAQRISFTALVAAGILMAEWRVRGTPHVPVPYVYPVDLRYFLSPPVEPTEATNPIGVATYLAEITAGTDLVGLARDMVEAFRTDLADGVIQQSLLHFSLQYEGNPPGLPDIVMISDGGEMPPVRTPAGLVVTGYQGEVLFSSSAGFDMYACVIYGGQLLVEYHSHAPGPQRCIAEVRDLLSSVLSEYHWATD